MNVIGLPPYLFVTFIGRCKEMFPYPELISFVSLSSWNPFSVCGCASGSFEMSARSPYICCPIDAILNYIKFMVSVPVLSLKTYSI